jgi:hypothetical protein
MMRILLFGFIAGVLSVLIFHQGSAFLLYHIGNEIPAVVAVQVGRRMTLSLSNTPRVIAMGTAN